MRMFARRRPASGKQMDSRSSNLSPDWDTAVMIVVRAKHPSRNVPKHRQRIASSIEPVHESDYRNPRRSCPDGGECCGARGRQAHRNSRQTRRATGHASDANFCRQSPGIVTRQGPCLGRRRDRRTRFHHLGRGADSGGWKSPPVRCSLAASERGSGLAQVERDRPLGGGPTGRAIPIPTCRRHRHRTHRSMGCFCPAQSGDPAIRRYLRPLLYCQQRFSSTAPSAESTDRHGRIR